MKKFLAPIVLVVSLVALAAPVFASLPQGPIEDIGPVPKSEPIMVSVCLRCYQTITGTKAQCDDHIASCTGTKVVVTEIIKKCDYDLK